MNHEMLYRAGITGFAHLGIVDSHPCWFCSCNAWSFPAAPMPDRDTGNNQEEAERAHREHSISAGGLPVGRN